MRKLTIFVLVALLVFAVGGTGVMAQQKKVVVGNKNFTEQYIIGEMMKILLEEKGFNVRLMSDLSTMALREGIEAGDIDIAADYTGTAWMTHLGFKQYPGMSNVCLYYSVKAVEEARNDFVWVNPIWNNNTYAMASWPEFARKNNLDTLSDLAAYYRKNNGKVETFIDFEFSTRPDGLPALEEFYNFHVDEAYLKTGAPGASLLALQNRQVDVAMVFGTDSAIAKNDWLVYKDDKSFFPPYDLCPYVRAEVLDKYPEIEKILNELVATFPGGGEFPSGAELAAAVSKGQQAWQELNAMVDVEKMEPDEAARKYLKDHGLIR
ncbi:MAG: glycine betaine ABC transporter substrate-binding protein [Spirochaetota bacterium]